VQPGETVLVMGAGGGIGTAAVQVALGLGTRVVAGVADEDQVATARSAGAPDVVVLDRGSSARIRELTGGREVDAVLDPLGDWLFDKALRALTLEGRILQALRRLPAPDRVHVPHDPGRVRRPARPPRPPPPRRRDR
jgi:NADPH:quinone reductase